MTKAGEQILEGMNEAVAVANGDQPAARLWHKGHAYVPEAELNMLTKSGIIEVAIRNPSVAEYMEHWEARAEKAEAQLEALRAVIEPFVVAAGQAPLTHGPDSEPIGNDEPVRIWLCDYPLGDVTASQLRSLYYRARSPQITDKT